jgi:hypothetical protein
LADLSHDQNFGTHRTVGAHFIFGKAIASDRAAGIPQVSARAQLKAHACMTQPANLDSANQLMPHGYGEYTT